MSVLVELWCPHCAAPSMALPGDDCPRCAWLSPTELMDRRSALALYAENAASAAETEATDRQFAREATHRTAVEVGRHRTRSDWWRE